MEPLDIIHGKSIGEFQLGWSEDELISRFISSYERKDLTTEQKIVYKNFHFWVDKATKKVKQISVTGDFRGKFLHKISLGSTLQDVENQIGKWDEELDVYILPNYRGICFELKDSGIDEEWNENEMPIELISVYEPMC